MVRMATSFIVWVGVASVSWAGPGDPRDIANGVTIYAHGYCDQPYVAVAEDGTWICVFTTSPKHEGFQSQYIACTTSQDQGQTWTAPQPIEPPEGPEASWGMPLMTRFGRVYVFYTYNGDNVRTLPNGKAIRADTLGWYCYRYSDNQGATWSKRYRLPMRVTACDRGNEFGGNVQLFWGIGKPVVHGDTAWFAFTKLGRFPLGEGEGWFYRSDNVLTEPDVSRVRWALLPDGEHGVRHPDFGDVQEEHNLVPLSNGDLYCIYRTTLGHPVESYSRDGGHTWSLPAIACYANGQPMKTPRACPRLWRTNNGRFLFWYHNHSGTDFSGRNPAWLVGGVERDGRILWSQPEILLYGADHSDKTGRFSYPDLVEANGRYWVTTTQKTQASVHEIDPLLLEGLWQQMDAQALVTKGLVLELDKPEKQEVPMPRLPGLGEGGFSIDFRVAFEDDAQHKPGKLILDSRDETGRGILVRTGAECPIEIALNDGEHEAVWGCDAGALGEGPVHHVSIIVDGGPDIITFVVDGVLCDGATQRQYGWGRFDPATDDVNGASRLRVAPAFAGRLETLRLYDRPLRTSEALSNHRALLRN